MFAKILSFLTTSEKFLSIATAVVGALLVTLKNLWEKEDESYAA